MARSSWMIGSHPAVPACDVTVYTDGDDEEQLDVLTSTSPLYLYNGGSGLLDALLRLQTAIRSYSVGGDLSGTDVYLTRDRTVQIDFEDAGGSPVSADISGFGGSGGSIMEVMMGLGSVLGGGASSQMTAAQISPYLWSPGMDETPDARLGESGIPFFDTAVGQAGTSRIVATTHNGGEINGFTWQRVLNERFWSSTPLGGEYFVWWEYVQRRFHRFKLWREVNELDGNESAATLSANLGPYKYRPESFPITFPQSRDLPAVEFLHSVRIPVVKVTEYS